MSVTQQAPFSILAIGDSLTAGYFVDGSIFHISFHPYQLELERLAKKHKVTNFQVVGAGVSGEQVLNTSMDRLSRLLADRAASGQPHYSHVFILGGINDIGWSTPAEDIFEGLKSMYHECKIHGARAVAMTVLAYNSDDLVGCTSNMNNRRQLNEMIRKYVKEHGEEENITLVDVDKLIRNDAVSPTGKSYWCDLLHLTPEGYDLMGRLLFDHVVRPSLPLADDDDSDMKCPPRMSCFPGCTVS